MRHTITVIALLGPCLAGAQAATPATLSDSAIDIAIRAGVDTKQSRMFATGEASDGFGGAMMRKGIPARYEIYVEGSAALIQSLAADNAKKYMPFTRDSVPTTAHSDYLFVRVVPGKPRFVAGHMYEAAPITHIVLQGRGTDSTGAPYPVIQPVSISKSQVAWQNMMGATYSGEAFLAAFPIMKIPDDGIDVVVVNTGEEWRLRIKKNEVESVR